MRGRSRFLLGVVAAGAAAVVSAAGQQPSADALIARARQAIGGNVLAAINTLSINGAMTLEFGGTLPSATRTVEVSFASPDKFLRVGRQAPSWPVDLTLTHYDGFNGPIPIRKIVPSMEQFAIYPNGPRKGEPHNEFQARVLLAQHDLFIQTMLPLFVTLPGHFDLKFEDGGKADYEGGIGHAIVLSRRGGGRWELLLDERTGLPVRLSWKSPSFVTQEMSSTIRREPAAGGVPTSFPPLVLLMDPPAGAPDVEWVMTIRDYRKVDGVNWPTRLVTTVAGKRHVDWKATRYRINPWIDPKAFERR